MQIKCTDQDLSATLIALDFAIRMWIGQYDKIEEVMRWNKDVDSIDVAGSVRPLIHRARNAVFPELTHIGYYGSFGVFNPERPAKGAVAYDMYQEFRYRQAYYHHPEGGGTVNFQTPLWCKDDPYQRPAASLCKEDGKDMAVLIVCKEQKDIIVEALRAYALLLETKLVDMLRIFTDNEEALELMREAEKRYTAAPYDPRIYTEGEREDYERLAEMIEKVTQESRNWAEELGLLRNFS